MRAVLVDLAQRVSWGTGTIGPPDLGDPGVPVRSGSTPTPRAREGLRQFVADLTTVYGLWSMICGRGAAPRAAA